MMTVDDGDEGFSFTGRSPRALASDHVTPATKPARFWSHWVSMFAGIWVFCLFVVPIKFVTEIANDSFISCKYGAEGASVCSPNSAVYWVGLGVVVLAAIATMYLVWVRPLMRSGATIGMTQMGLAMRRTDAADMRSGMADAATAGRLSSTKAWINTVVSHTPLIIVFLGAGWFLFYESTDKEISIFIYAIAAGVVVSLINSIWSFVNAQHRTLDEMIVDRSTVSLHRPSWLAIAALIAATPVLIGTLGMAFATMTSTESASVLIDSMNAEETFANPLVPTAATCLLGVVLGIFALRETRWGKHQRAGRGLASSATAMALSAPVIALVITGVVSLDGFINDRNDKTCTETRKDIDTALESYLVLNDTYPAELSAIGAPPFLAEPVDVERWDYSPPNDGARTYELSGIGDCENER